MKKDLYSLYVRVLFVFVFHTNKDIMHDAATIERHRTALLGVIEFVFRWLGLAPGEGIESASVCKKRTVVFVLLPAEAALRRLVFVMAVLLSVPVCVPRAQADRSASRRGKTGNATQRAKRPPQFRLFDPAHRDPSGVFWESPKTKKKTGYAGVIDLSGTYEEYRARRAEVFPKKSDLPEGYLPMAALCRRLNAVLHALKDMDAQALRMARAMARANAKAEVKGNNPAVPIRAGRPPGYRRRRKHEIDDILRACQELVDCEFADKRPPDKG